MNVGALRAMTDDSGGRTEIVRSSRDLGPATQNIADELSQQVLFRVSGGGEEGWPLARDPGRGPRQALPGPRPPRLYGKLIGHV